MVRLAIEDICSNRQQGCKHTRLSGTDRYRAIGLVAANQAGRSFLRLAWIHGHFGISGPPNRSFVVVAFPCRQLALVVFGRLWASISHQHTIVFHKVAINGNFHFLIFLKFVGLNELQSLNFFQKLGIDSPAYFFKKAMNGTA